MIWLAVLLGSALTFGTKLIGYALPTSLLERPVVRRIAGFIPIAMLAGLVSVQTFATGTAVMIDARLAGLAAAVIALLLRAPFLVVVIVAAATAGLLRYLGLLA